MKKSLYAVTLAGLYAGSVHAQSTVTLYGVIDEGLEYVSNVKTGPGQGKPLVWLDSSSGEQGSRWGLKGAEDLGGGLKAIFQLENGFEVNNGKLNQGGAIFGRQAFVGLSSAQWGSVTLGRQYDSAVDYVETLTAAAQWGSHRAAHPGDLDNLTNSYRSNNSIKFSSAKFGGFTFGGLYSFGGQAGSFTRNQIYSFGARYEQGPIALAAAYVNVRNPNISYYGNNPSSGGTTVNNIAPGSNPVFAGYASAHTQQIIAGGGNYTFGNATFGLVYSNVKFIGLGNTTESGPNPYGYTGNVTFNDVEVNASYRVTPALLVGAVYNFTKSNGATSTLPGVNNSGAKYHQFALGTDYLLSKRTDVYLVGVYQKAIGVDSLGEQAVASVPSETAASGNHAVVVRAGFRVRF